MSLQDRATEPRYNSLVRLLLGILRSLSERAFRNGLVHCARTIAQAACRQPYRSRATSRSHSAGFFAQNPTDARTALALFSDASEILVHLLEGGHSAIAGRLAGAFRNIGRERIADEIVKNMQAAGYTVRESDPFETRLQANLPARERSPYAGRIRLMWQAMREDIPTNFPPAPGRPNDIEGYLKRVEDIYVTDAYNPLSIEGYRVSPALIERVRSGTWNPDQDEQDREHRDALAARGYHLAFQSVKDSVRAVLKNENPGTVAVRDHGDWYRELFAPSVTVGLAGYRSDRVIIRNSVHVPLPPHAVRDAMPVFFELLEEEEDAATRVVLGHFIFVYIHPYMDGNGRMGRFLMNVMLAAGGLSLDRDPGTAPQRLHGRPGTGERPSEHLPVQQFHRRTRHRRHSR